uniref:SYO1-like TPR repeats domain-containing protein n=1 Tax=Glossina pallidipes TaxID=7398 RepID=A0A1A9ZHR3_GLOPL
MVDMQELLIELQLLLGGGAKNCWMPEIRANCLRMLRTLGCLLVELLVELITSFIVETCTQEEDVWTPSEALDALMDMSSDDDILLWHDPFGISSRIDFSKPDV